MYGFKLPWYITDVYCSHQCWFTFTTAQRTLCIAHNINSGVYIICLYKEWCSLYISKELYIFFAIEYYITSCSQEYYLTFMYYNRSLSFCKDVQLSIVIMSDFINVKFVYHQNSLTLLEKHIWDKWPGRFYGMDMQKVPYYAALISWLTLNSRTFIWNWSHMKVEFEGKTWRHYFRYQKFCISEINMVCYQYFAYFL